MGQFGNDEEETRKRAIAFARKNGKRISSELTDIEDFPSDPKPVSVFMAGSPGAGKTEASKALLKAVEKKGTKTLRIDPDELREQFEGYSGENAWLFQAAVSILVDKIHDNALKKRQNFLLDGTLSSYAKAKQNVERSLKRNRFVLILYVYQSPQMAWDFVKTRQRLEGRRILPEHFIEQYFAARKVVNQLKDDFGSDIVLSLLLKNLDGSDKMYKANVDLVDHHVPERFSENDLLKLIKDDIGS